MSDTVRTVVAALVVSSVTTAGTMVLNQGTTQRLLEDNITAVRALTQTVTDLRLTIAEKYVTKEELERRLNQRAAAMLGEVDHGS